MTKQMMDIIIPDLMKNIMERLAQAGFKMGKLGEEIIHDEIEIAVEENTEYIAVNATCPNCKYVFLLQLPIKDSSG